MEENMQEKLEEIAMMIIANSGQARSDAFAALQEAKKGNFEDAEKILKKRVFKQHTNLTENC